MSKVATLSLDARTNKWQAMFAGRVLAASPNKDYVITNIRTGRCTKAREAGVTDVQEIGQVETNTLTGIVQKVDKFAINERFDFLTEFVNMVADRTSPSLIVTGEGGLGKTHTVLASLKKSGLQDLTDVLAAAAPSEDDDEDFNASPTINAKYFSIVKGYSTAKGLYRTLWENRNRVVLFDDCDSIIRDPVALNLLKAALDSYDKRVISWNAEGFGDDDLPRSFEFRGGVISISNMPIFKLDQALRTRAICVDLTMNTAQKIERMEAIIKLPDFLPNFELKVKREALDFLEKMKDETRELNLRTLISLVKVASRGGDWMRRAEYLLTSI